MDALHRRRTLALLGLACLGVLGLVALSATQPEHPRGAATVTLTIEDPDGALLLRDNVTVPANENTVLRVLYVAQQTHGFAIEMEGAYVRALYGFEPQGACGWQYWVDDTHPQVAAGAYYVEDGDRVAWRWACGGF